MEAGLPVVASRVGGLPEVMADGQTGWLVPPEDPERLAEALAAALAAGRQRVDDEFRPAHAAARWHEAVDDRMHGLDRGPQS